MRQTYAELLGLSDIKPLECVGTFEEMSEAYRMSASKHPSYVDLGLEPKFSDDNWRSLGKHQKWLGQLIDYSNL